MIGNLRLRYFISAFFLLSGCVYKEIPQPTLSPFDCSQSTLALSQASKTNTTTCFSIDGSFTVHASGGAKPYLFSYDGGTFTTDSTHSSLGPGTYLITVQDANKCTKSTSVEIEASGTTLDATAAIVDDTECLTNNGSIDVTASGGDAPYTYQFGSNAPDANHTYTGLKFGYYTIIVRDNSGCIHTVNAWVHRGDTQTSYQTQIQPIIAGNCAIPGCHDGSDAIPNWNVFVNVQQHADNIKKRTQNKTMPLTGSLTQDQIDLIACWVDDGAKDN